MEQEPNDRMKQSNELELNREISGYINTPSDIDNYFFRTAEAQILRISLSAVKGVNHAVKIWRIEQAGPVLLKIIDDNRKSSPEEFANFHAEKGTYVISILHGDRDIKKANTESEYRLFVSSSSQMDEEKEPNDKYSESNMIAGGIPVQGYFSPAQNKMNRSTDSTHLEEDWFSFSAELKGGSPLIARISLSGVTGIDSTLRLFNSSMKEIARSDSGASGAGEEITDFGIRESGIYYLSVSAKNYQFSHNEKYELLLQLREFDPAGELEPNGTIENAGIIRGNEVSGKSSGPEDQDFFVFNPENKNLFYRIELENSSGLDTALAVYSPNKDPLFTINSSLQGQSEIIPAVRCRDLLYAEIRPVTGAGPDGAYRLKFIPLELTGNFETEPNDSTKTAGVLNEYVRGFTSTPSDRDYFLVKAGSRQKFRVTAEAGESSRIKISTTDPLGYIINSKTAAGNSPVSFVEMFDRKGFIVVETEKADYYNPYTIKIEALK